MEFLLGSNDLFLDKVILWVDLKFRLFIFNQLLHRLIQKGFSHLYIFCCFCIFDIQYDHLVHRVGVATV